MNNSPLEFLAQRFDNVVKYDADGNPSIYVRFPKMKSVDLDSSLPDHWHPTFKINDDVKDSVLFAKYKASEIKLGDNGNLYSIPNVAPRVNLGADQLLARMRAAHVGCSGMTVADYGFLLLLAQKMGWNTQKGNNSYGVDYQDATIWATGQSISIGDKRAFRGWEYTAQKAHTTSNELAPHVAPVYWKKGKQVGAIMRADQFVADNQYRGYNHLNGTGPLSWFLGGDPSMPCDLVGSCFEANYGYRLVNCELQILPDNNAADPTADLSASSTAWKAILPNPSDDGYTLVAPGTEGTLHWTWANSKITLDTVEPTFDNESRGTYFKDLAVNSNNLPYIPSIVRELGLYPTPGSTMAGYYYIQFTRDERFPRRGSSYYNSSFRGLGCVYSSGARGNSYVTYGARPRSL